MRLIPPFLGLLLAGACSQTASNPAPSADSLIVTVTNGYGTGRHKMGVEGKEYILQDGDIMHFRFNV